MYILAKFENMWLFTLFRGEIIYCNLCFYTDFRENHHILHIRRAHNEQKNTANSKPLKTAHKRSFQWQQWYMETICEIKEENICAKIILFG